MVELSFDPGNLATESRFVTTVYKASCDYKVLTWDNWVDDGAIDWHRNLWGQAAGWGLATQSLRCLLDLQVEMYDHRM